MSRKNIVREFTKGLVESPISAWTGGDDEEIYPAPEGREDGEEGEEDDYDGEPERLACMGKEGAYGARWGPTDWLDNVRSGIQQALQAGKPFTTGWYGVQKEIQTACITGSGGEITCEVNCSDDYNTEGHGEVTIPWTDDLDKVEKALDESSGIAEEDRKDNCSVLTVAVGYVGPDGNRTNWIDTYLIDSSGWGLDSPPGDYHCEWGWQEQDEEIPLETREKLEEQIQKGNLPVVIDGFKAEILGEDEPDEEVYE